MSLLHTRWKKEASIYGPVVEFVQRIGGLVDVKVEGSERRLLLPRDPETGGPKGYSMIQEVTT